MAALNARTGQIVWRKVFEPKQGVIHRLLSNSNSLLTVSGNGKVVRSWDMVKGNLQWESNALKYSDSNEEAIEGSQRIMHDQQAFLLDQDSGGGILLTSNKMVKVISQNDGTNIWEYEDTKDTVVGAAQHNEEIIVLCIRLFDQRKFFVFKYLDAETGKFTSEAYSSALWLSSSFSVKCTITPAKFLACVGSKERLIMARSILKKTQELFVVTPLENLKIEKTQTITEHSISNLVLVGTESLLQIRLNPTLNILVKLSVNAGIASLVKVLPLPGLFFFFFITQ